VIVYCATVSAAFEILVKVKVHPLQATKILSAGRGIVLPYLRPRH
jgi:hypothetical protein